MNKKDWPRTKGSTKKKDNDHLPLHIRQLSFLTDSNHHKKVVGQYLYEMPIATQKISKIDRALTQQLNNY